MSLARYPVSSAISREAAAAGVASVGSIIPPGTSSDQSSMPPYWFAAVLGLERENWKSDPLLFQSVEMPTSAPSDTELKAGVQGQEQRREPGTELATVDQGQHLPAVAGVGALARVISDGVTSFLTTTPSTLSLHFLEFRSARPAGHGPADQRKDRCRA